MHDKRGSRRFTAFLSAVTVVVGGVMLAPVAAYAETDAVSVVEERQAPVAPLTEPGEDGLEIDALGNESALETDVPAGATVADDVTADEAQKAAAETEEGTPEAPAEAESVTDDVASDDSVADDEAPEATETGAVAYAPEITVTFADGKPVTQDTVVHDGDELVVRGTGFDPEANVGGRGMPIPKHLPQGTYVVFGKFADVWQPSVEAPASARAGGPQRWVLSESVLDQVPGHFQGTVRAQWANLSDDGTFETSITVDQPTDRDGQPVAWPETGNFGIYTYAAGGAVNAAQELAVPVTYGAERAPASEETEPAATGGLVWSFKASWNGYLRFAAQGQRLVSNGATLGANNEVGFVQVEGGDYDASTGLGTIRYQGTFNDVSANHRFDIEFSDPWVTFTKNGATMSAVVSEQAPTGETAVSRVDVATLNTEASERDEDGVLAWAGVSGEFLPSLQPSEWADYAGEAIDPVTFTFAGTAVDPISPAMVTVNKPSIKQGETLEIVGTGFEPGATVNATVHSTPVQLPAATADVDGSVRFTWAVPTDFTLGDHRIVLESADTTVETTFTVTEAAAEVVAPVVQNPEPVVEECVARGVTGGSLSWGFLDAFRAYTVNERLSKGTWSGGYFNALNGGVNPEASGIGTINFGGSIVATGHGGLMNYELSAPSIQITGPQSAVLYASTSTTDTSGQPSVSGRVALATLSFAGLSVNADAVSVSGAAATLTPAGSSHFGDFSERYPAGTALDPVSFSVTLGGEVPCDSTTDPVELAATGASDTGSSTAMIFAALAMLIGAGLLAARRRPVPVSAE